MTKQMKLRETTELYDAILATIHKAFYELSTAEFTCLAENHLKKMGELTIPKIANKTLRSVGLIKKSGTAGSSNSQKYSTSLGLSGSPRYAALKQKKAI